MASSGSDLLWEPYPAPTSGVVGDANTMRVDPSHLGFGQDCLVDTTGILRSRGGYASYTASTFTTQFITGATQLQINALVPSAGTMYLSTSSSGNSLRAYGTSAAALTGWAQLTVSCPTASTQDLITSGGYFTPSFAKLPSDAGAVGACGYWPKNNNWGMAFMWGGNATVTSDTTTGTAASTVGSKTITGVGTAWTTALIGCYLYIGTGTAAVYVGQVDQVTSTTVILLKKGAIKTIAAATPNFKTIRMPIHTVYKGRITASTASAVVVGSNTKFANSGPAGSGSVWMTSPGGALVFRYSDGAYVGQVTSVQNDTTLTLTGNAAISMVNEEYVIYCQSATPNVMLMYARAIGAFSATCVELYADRYWYGCIAASDDSIKAGVAITNNAVVTAPFIGSNSLCFSKKRDAECLDLSPIDGDILTITAGNNADVIRGLSATKGGLCVFRGYDTFLVTGYSPETFRLVKILDDGVLNSAMIKPYKEGVIWAGRQSLWYFDGTRIVDLLENKVKKFYQRVVGAGPSQTVIQPTGVAIVGNYVLFSYLPASTVDRTWPYKNTTTTLNGLTLCLNMLNGSVTFFTNLVATNSFVNSDDGAPIITAVGYNGTSSFLVKGNTIFQDSSTAADNFDALTMGATLTAGQSVGPDVMFETTKLVMGDATRLKFWKRLLLNYSSNVAMTATLIGTNTTTVDFPNISTGTASTDSIAVSATTGILHRMRFLVRSSSLVVRIYQTSSSSATSQRFRLFWWAVGGKRMRQGRVEP